MDAPKILDSAGTFLAKLTWMRIGMVLVLVLIAGGATWAWLSRESFVQMVKPAKFSAARLPLVVDDKAQKVIEDTLRKAPMFAAIAVVSVAMEQNTRKIILFHSLDPKIQLQRDSYEATHPSTDIALFISENQENNTRIIALIGGEMVCFDFKNSQSARFLSETDIKWICTVGTPPYFGEFRGFVVVYLRKVPTPEDLVQIRVVLRDLSNSLDNPPGK